MQVTQFISKSESRSKSFDLNFVETYFHLHDFCVLRLSVCGDNGLAVVGRILSFLASGRFISCGNSAHTVPQAHHGRPPSFQRAPGVGRKETPETPFQTTSWRLLGQAQELSSGCALHGRTSCVE